ncbi:MAG: hypothetical protein ACI4WW_03220 [Candidatus Coprovivens sp.]
MKIIKFTKLKSNKYTVYFDDGTNIKLYDDVIIKYNLLSNKELDDDKIDEIVKYNDRLGSYYKALKYITKRQRTEKEVYEYLVKDYTRKTTEETIDRLKIEGYFKKDIYLKSYINDAVNLNLIGPNKIKDNLKKLGFNDDEIKPFIDNISDDILLGKVERLVNKKVKANHQYGINKLREKIFYDISNLGFPKWMIEEKVKDLEIDNSDSILDREFNKLYSKLSRKFEGNELFFQIKVKLLQRGFNYNEVEEFIQNKKND